MFHPEGPTFLELARQALSSTREGYQLLAPKFDHTPFRTPDEILAAVFAHQAPVETALDLCCGTGAALSHLRRLTSRQVVGLDFSANMLAEAGRTWDRETRAGAATPSEGLTLLEGDVLDLALPARFDLITCFGALGHIPRRDQQAFVVAVRRALRPGGRFVLVTAHAPGPGQAAYWLGRGFNLAMDLRNLCWPGRFVMYYLTFLLPEARTLLTGAGFHCRLLDPLPCPWPGRLVMLTASV